MKRKTIMAGLAVAGLFFMSCQTPSDSVRKDSSVEFSELEMEDLAGTAWIHPICGMPGEGQFPSEGFYLAEDGALFFINIFSMTGDTWEMKDGKLVQYSHTGRYPDPQPDAYNLRLEGDTLTLYPENGTGEGTSYTRAESPDSIPEGVWTLQYMRNPEGIDAPGPEDKMPDFAIHSEGEGWQIGGFAGVNRFFGSIELSGGRWKGGPFMSTMMAGPYLDYELLFLQTLETADRFLRIDGHLFLFDGTEAAALFQLQ